MGIAGTADFAQRLSERLGRPGQARARNETDEHLAERLIQDWMNTTGWTEAQLAARAKSDAEKATLAAPASGDADDAGVDCPTAVDGQRQLRLAPDQRQSPR